MSIPSSSSLTTATTQLTLSTEVRAILNNGLRNGFEEDVLDLSERSIFDQLIPELCAWILKLDDKVKAIQLDENPITSNGAIYMFDTFRTSSAKIKAISIGNRMVGNTCMKALGEYIKANKSIEQISLSYANLSDAGIKVIAPYLEGNTTLRFFLLNGNPGITNEILPVLSHIVKSSNIEAIDITQTLVTRTNALEASLACNAFKNGSEFLEFSSLDMEDKDIESICEGMKKFGIGKLKEINNHGWKVTPKGVSLMFDSFRECNSTLSKVRLYGDGLNDEITKSVGEFIEENKDLEELAIGSRITDKGLEFLSNYLIGNKTLKTLDLYSNKGITDASFALLIEIAEGSHLTELNLYDTSVSEENKQKVNEAIKLPIDQRKIPIKSKSKSAAKISSSATST